MEMPWVVNRSPNNQGSNVFDSLLYNFIWYVLKQYKPQYTLRN